MKVGWVKLSKPDLIPIGVKYTKPTISYDNKYWYISVGIEKGTNNVQLTEESIGIDLGIKELVVVSNINKPFKNINKTQTVKKIKNIWCLYGKGNIMFQLVQRLECMN